MSDKNADKEAAILKAANPNAEDRGESVGLMEPLLVGESSRHRAGLADLAAPRGGIPAQPA